MSAGIYCFEHKTYPIIYIGASKNIQSRYEKHINEFKSGRHPNRALNRDYLNEELTFGVLEKTSNKSKKYLTQRENYYFHLYLENGYLLYNRVPPIQSSDDYLLMTGLNKTFVPNSYKEQEKKNFQKNIRLNKKIKKQEEQINSLKEHISDLQKEIALFKKYEINIFDEL